MTERALFMRTGRPNHAKAWDVGDLELLATLIRDGHTIPQIAKALGRSQEGVRTKAHALGILERRARRKPNAEGANPRAAGTAN